MRKKRRKYFVKKQRKKHFFRGFIKLCVSTGLIVAFFVVLLNTTATYNAKAARKTIWDHLKKGVGIVKMCLK